MNDMTDDVFANHSYAKIAMKQFYPVSSNFRIYSVEWLGDGPPWKVMKIVGCEFRVAKSGKNKGKLCIPVKGSKKTTYVSAHEMQELEKENVNG